MSLTPLYNEGALLQQVASDDETAFRKVFDHYRPQLYNMAHLLTRDQSLAEDILQETFLKIWLKRHTLDTIGNFPGWLFTVYQNFMLNAIKRINKVKQGQAALQQTQTGQINLPDFAVETKEIELIMGKAINRLSDKQRQTYRLIKEQGMSRAEAAGAMNIGTETVKTHLENALRSIRAFCLKELEHHPFAPYWLIFIKIFF